MDASYCPPGHSDILCQKCSVGWYSEGLSVSGCIKCTNKPANGYYT